MTGTGSRLFQLGDNVAEDNWKSAIACSVLPVFGMVPSSSRVGALAVSMSGWLGWLDRVVEGVPALK